VATATRTPFIEDSAAHQVAEILGFKVSRRYDAVEIVDEDAVKRAGFVTREPRIDFRKLSRALQEGQPVEGARLLCWEYILVPVNDVEANPS